MVKKKPAWGIRTCSIMFGVRWLVHAQVNGRDRSMAPQLTPLLVADSRAQIHSQATRADRTPSSAPLSQFRVSQRILVFDLDAWHGRDLSHRWICAHARIIPPLGYRRITSDGVKSSVHNQKSMPSQSSTIWIAHMSNHICRLRYT